LILPFLEQDRIYDEFHLDEAWDSPNNIALLENIPRVYRHPRGLDEEYYRTPYQVLVGPGTAFEKDALTFDDFSNDLGKTILVVEAKEPVPWTKPDDLAYDPDGPLPEMGGQVTRAVRLLGYEIKREPGFVAGFADGTSRFIPSQTDEKRIRALISRHGRETASVGGPWTQNYDPFNSPALSPLVAALPILLLLGLLATGRVPAAWAALAGLACAVFLAIVVFTPLETLQSESGGQAAWAQTVFAAAGTGAAFGLLPIGWIVLSAIFLYMLTVDTGHFEIVKHSVVALSDDRRIQALLIAFCFGAFVEGAAGFGTPVAISAALLMGAGFRPLHAAGLALLANTSPVAFGALGTPILTLGKVTGLDTQQLSAMAGRQLPFFSVLVPVWLVWVMSGWRGVVGVWPALLVCGGSFAGVQFLVANYVGPELVDVAGGLISLACLALFLRVWQPRETWHFSHEGEASGKRQANPPPAVRRVVSAWVPWLLLTVFVFCWGWKPIKNVLDQVTLTVQVPALHNAVARTKPVEETPKPEEAEYRFNWLSATGTGIFLAAILSAIWLRIRARRFLYLFGLTLHRLRWPLVTIACMLAIAYTTRYSGMDATLGIAFTHTGKLYPLFAALLGWMGVALTGSDTSSNALFGSLQTITARRLVADGRLPLTSAQAMLLLATANSTGGVMGKMIDAQSIVVSAAATQQPGQEGAILRFVFWHSLALAVLMGMLVLGQAHLWSGMIP
jgi:lactate permease